MGKTLKDNIESISLEASRILYKMDESETAFEKLCNYLYSQYEDPSGYVSLYIVDESKTMLVEETITTEYNVRDGINILQVKEMQEILCGDKFHRYENDYGHCLRVPIYKNSRIIGLIELFSFDEFDSAFVNNMVTIGDAVSLGINYNILLRENRMLNNKLFFNTDLPKILKNCSTAMQAMREYALYVVKSLEFDRVSIFLNKELFEEENYNVCVNFKGETLYIDDTPDIPEMEEKPLELDNISGYWVPVTSGDRYLASILYDNIYSSYHLSEQFKDTLTFLTTQFSVALDNFLLLEGIRKMAQSDVLTGLYNRSYLEQMLLELNLGDMLPCSVILGDVNGLKLTNDVFGHIQGDTLIKNIAKIIKGVSEPHYTAARWGGDEFLILMPHTGEKETLEVCRKIAAACEDSKDDIKPSISLGHATSYAEDTEMAGLFKKAEDMMYRMKMLDKNSFRNIFITSLQETLREKCGETSEHIERLYLYSQRIGQRLGLSDIELNDLKLLAYLHDIGKVAISDAILNKPGKLTQGEWDIMKSHSEIGYRIVHSAPELSNISKFVLYHHERWDGRGYPEGLSGNNIPRLSRIITILDSYDVMTSQRCYKAAMTHNEAVAELLRCSGTQFDPYLIEIMCKDGGKLFL